MRILGDHLATIETRFGQAIDRMYDTPESSAAKPAPHLWPAVLYPSDSRRGYYVAPFGITDEVTVSAVVNHGRWLTLCPFCPSAQEASAESHLFYCATCQNEAIGNAAIRVEWPDDADAVEATLLERPFRENRSWVTGETVADLVVENAANGVVV